MASDVRMLETGYKRKHQKVCDRCGSPDLSYVIKGWIKCDKCGRLYSKNHVFQETVE